MIFIIAMLYSIIFLFLFSKQLKKHPNIFYIFALIIAISLVIYKYYDLKIYFNDFINTYFIQVFRRGAFTTALFTIVMFLPVFKGKSNIVKSLYGIRAEISIFASILTLGHNISYGLTYFPQFIYTPQDMKPGAYLATITTLIMMAIMLILTITSFPNIRKKMSWKTWKNIQRSAYLFYMLIYVHVMILFLYSKHDKTFEVIVYSIVFIGYFVMRLIRAYIDKRNRNAKLAKAKI